MGGLEWTVKFTQRGQSVIYEKAKANFETLWHDHEFEHYDPGNEVHRNTLIRALKRENLSDSVPRFTFFELEPKSYQATMLESLVAERAHGRDVSHASPSARDYGIVFQSYALFPNLTIRDNVAYGLVNRRKSRADIEARVAELLKLVGLPDSGAKYPSQLSGGQQQRIALARALATSPSLLLLDEPLSALDAKERERLRGEIRALQRRLHVTTVMVTHDQEEALSIADNIAVMDNAHIEQVGGPRELYDTPANPFVMGFLGPVARLDGTLVRPHDIAIEPEPDHGGREAQVKRVSHLGFEVRVDLELEDGEPVFAQLTRTEAEALDLNAGDIVWLRTAGGTVLAA